MPASRSARRLREKRAIMAYQLRFIDGRPMPEVAAALGVSREHSYRLVRCGVQLCVGEELRESARASSLAELDALRATAYQYLNREYALVQLGKVVTGEDGKPLKDIGPNLAALDRILKLEKRRSEIFGYDAPRRTAVKVVTDDAVMAEIRRLEAELADSEAGR